MVREDIVGGLNSALARGQSVKQAMMSFYNAGYTKEEIEEAARFLKSGQNNLQPQQQLQVQKPVQTQIQQKQPEAKQNVSSYGMENSQQKKPQIQQPKKIIQKNQGPVQNVSGYGKQNPKGKLAIAVLAVILFLLLASFAAVFFFRNEIIAFFSTP